MTTNGKTDDLMVGEVTQILGSVVDVRFPKEGMPETYYAVEIDMGTGTPHHGTRG